MPRFFRRRREEPAASEPADPESDSTSADDQGSPTRSAEGTDMAKDKPQEQSAQPNAEETVTTPEGQNQQTQLRVDDSQATTYYSSTSRISGSGEEIIVDFSQGVRPSGQPNIALLKIDARVILSPWAAKRLALALSQTVQRYEQTYGTLEIDPRKRQQQGQQAAQGQTSQAR